MILKKATSFKLAIGWFCFISFLFFLPGSSLPKNNIFTQIYFDKWVHFGFFFILLWLWCKGLEVVERKGLFPLLMLAGIYGLMVEILQDQLVPYRSFDIYDLVADLVGAMAGIWWYHLRYIKK